MVGAEQVTFFISFADQFKGREGEVFINDHVGVKAGVTQETFAGFQALAGDLYKDFGGTIAQPGQVGRHRQSVVQTKGVIEVNVFHPDGGNLAQGQVRSDDGWFGVDDFEQPPAKEGFVFVQVAV